MTISIADGFPEGAPAPDMPPEGPQMPPEPVSPEVEGMHGVTGGPYQSVPEDPYSEGNEIEGREKLLIELTVAATDMANACKMMRAENDAERAEKFAVAAQRLTQAVVLLSPLEASDDLATGQVGSSPERVQLADSASKGMRRSAQ